MNQLARTALASLVFAGLTFTSTAVAQPTVHGGFAPPRVPSDRGVAASEAPDLWIATSEGFRTLTVRSMTAQESMPLGFDVTVEVETDDASITPRDLLERLVTLGVRESASELRIRSAFVVGVSGRRQSRPDGSVRQMFVLSLAPWTAVLSRTSGYAIYENVTPSAVLRAVFGRYAFADVELRVRQTERPRERIVQYRESDLSFVRRVMSEAGLFAYFEHRAHGHRLVVTDTPPSLPRALPVLEQAGSDPTTAVHASTGHTGVEPTRYRLANRDPRDPSRAIVVEHRAERSSRFGDIVISDHLERFGDRATGERRAADRLAGARHGRWLHGITQSSLELGDAFALRGHPDPETDGRYRVVSTSWSAGTYGQRPGQPLAIETSFEALPLSAPIRMSPELETRADPQLATVVGPTPGQPNVDERGRVRVRFHWAPGPDGEMPTAWVPLMGGGAWRPNAGELVLVHFLDGEPSQPIVWTR